MLYFSKNFLLLICLVLQLLIIQASQSVGYEKTKYLDLSIYPFGFEFSTMYLQTLASLGFWKDDNGFEIVGGSDIFRYNTTKIKYMKRFKDKNYWSFGVAQTKAKIYDSIGLGSSIIAEYDESAIYLSLGLENPLYFDWIVCNLEGGYIFSFANNFSGDYSKYPHSRPYGSISIKFRWFI